MVQYTEGRFYPTLYSTVICSQDRSGAKNRFCNTVKCTHYQTPHFRPSFNAPFSFFFIGLRRRCRYCIIAKQNPAAHQDHCGRFEPGTSVSPRRLVLCGIPMSHHISEPSILALPIHVFVYKVANFHKR